MNISIFVAGSSRRKVAMASHASRRTRTHSSPCCEPVSMISPPENWAFTRSRTFCDTLTLAARKMRRARLDGRHGHVDAGALGLQLHLAVALAALDALLQQNQS